MLSDKVQGLDQIYFEHPTDEPNLETWRSGDLEIWNDWVSWRKRALVRHI
jgi:hypothetical protein